MSVPAISAQTARRLAISCQQLAGPAGADVLSVMRGIRCLQLDPIRAVEYTQRLVLWSRIGQFDVNELETELWEERRLFEYWAHAASIVLTEDFPIHNAHMRRLASGNRRPSSKAWMKENAELKVHVLRRLEADGPLPAAAIEDISRQEWRSTGWTNGRTVNTMLEMLWSEGAIMVAGRKGRTRLWDLSERCLPVGTMAEEISPATATRMAVQHALRALGVATAKQLNCHFTRFRYQNLRGALANLVSEGVIHEIRIGANGLALPDTWYIHRDHLERLERVQGNDWQPRTTLLSPFDNLICDRERTERLFDFQYRIEIYVPPARRLYGYYVLPILHGDRLIGRIDPKMDRAANILRIQNMYIEEGVEAAASGDALAAAIRELAIFLGARKVEAPADGHGPAAWISAVDRYS